MIEDIKIIEKTILTINEAMYDIFGDEFNDGELPRCSFSTDGYCQLITFGDFNVWDSENDERPWNDNDEPEPIDEYVFRIINSYCQKIGKIEFGELTTEGN
jgi:hypothetical protein